MLDLSCVSIILDYRLYLLFFFAVFLDLAGLLLPVVFLAGFVFFAVFLGAGLAGFLLAAFLGVDFFFAAGLVAGLAFFLAGAAFFAAGLGAGLAVFLAGAAFFATGLGAGLAGRLPSPSAGLGAGSTGFGCFDGFLGLPPRAIPLLPPRLHLAGDHVVHDHGAFLGGHPGF